MSCYRLFCGIYLFYNCYQLSFMERLVKFVLSLLDIEIIQTMALNYKFSNNKPSNPQRLIQILEACFEAAPQSIIQTVYLWQTQQFLHQFLLYFFTLFLFFSFCFLCVFLWFFGLWFSNSMCIAKLRKKI